MILQKRIKKELNSEKKRLFAGSKTTALLYKGLFAFTLAFTAASKAAPSKKVDGKEAQKEAAGKEAAARPVQVKVKPLALTEVNSEVLYPASVVSAQYTLLRADRMGIVGQVLVNLGQKVKRGQRLLSLKNSDPVFTYEDRWLTAPVDGVLGELFVRSGQSVQAGEALTSVIDPDEFIITMEIPFKDGKSLGFDMPENRKDIEFTFLSFGRSITLNPRSLSVRELPGTAVEASASRDAKTQSSDLKESSSSHLSKKADDKMAEASLKILPQPYLVEWVGYSPIVDDKTGTHTAQLRLKKNAQMAKVALSEEKGSNTSAESNMGLFYHGMMGRMLFKLRPEKKFLVERKNLHHLKGQSVIYLYEKGQVKPLKVIKKADLANENVELELGEGDFKQVEGKSLIFDASEPLSPNQRAQVMEQEEAKL